MKSHLKLIYHFEVLWVCPAAPYQDQLIISMDVYPHQKINSKIKINFSTLSRNIGLSGILHSDWLRGSLTIKQNLRNLPDMAIGMASRVTKYSFFQIVSSCEGEIPPVG